MMLVRDSMIGSALAVQEPLRPPQQHQHEACRPLPPRLLRLPSSLHRLLVRLRAPLLAHTSHLARLVRMEEATSSATVLQAMIAGGPR